MTLKIAKQFFTAHQSVIIAHHWRSEEVAQSNRESMFNHPRAVRKVGSRKVTFAHSLGVSELDLSGASAAVEGDTLHLMFAENGAPRPHISYRAVEG